MVDKALADDTRRVSILRRMSMFIRRMVERSRYAHTMGAPREEIVYTRRGRHPPPKESEAVQDKAGTSQPIVQPDSQGNGLIFSQIGAARLKKQSGPSAEETEEIGFQPKREIRYCCQFRE